MTGICIAYVLLYAALMVVASTTIDTPNRNRGIILSGLHLIALIFLLVQT